MKIPSGLATVSLMLAAVGATASPPAWPECRVEIQELLATNTLAFWASAEGGGLRYTMRIDAERWDGLERAGQDDLEALLSCSISAGGDTVPYLLSVRSAYSNRELARYHNGERQSLD